jgi:hypothetical protein
MAMITHAAGESSSGNIHPHTHAVVLAAANEQELLQASALLSDIPHSLVREPEVPWNGQAMALGCYVISRKKIRKLLRKYPLYV